MGGFVGNVSYFLWYTQYNLEYLTLNTNHMVIHSMLELTYYFEFIVFVLLSYIFPGIINRQVLKSNIFIRTS